MSKMWEIDPETRSKLLEISKSNENNRCVDCGAPSPQWASPKLGIFFCLACSGIHRSLGVHISFVRSVTMDAFKTAEVKRMELGGNKPWKDFFNAHSSNTLIGRDFDSCTIAERYDSDAGEEWKDRLTAKVEGTEYVPGSSKPASKKQVPATTGGSSTPGNAGSGRSTPLSNLRSAPPQKTASPGQKERNEAYFARMGADNANRPEHLAPSQGGKYAGFGSSPMPTTNSSAASGGVPTADDFQADPMAALTKGFGWLSSTVSKQAANVNRAYIQPGMKNLQEGDFAAQARAAAANWGNTVQQGTKGIGDQFNKFVDPEYASSASGGGAAQRSRAAGGAAAEPEKKDFWDSFGQDPNGPPKEKKGFWDDFAAAGQSVNQQQQKSKPTTLGTSAMKTSGASGGSGVGAGPGAAAATSKKEDDGWGADW